MSILNIISAIFLLITSILVVIVIAMQESRQSGVSGAISGGSSSMDSYLGKNRGRTLDATLARITKIFATFLFLVTLAVNIVYSIIK